ncbi:MAG: exodeoxyribonuclease VII small subunit [Ruminococcus sp.]|nr:exodeoxyribonuclease VII small subunit [Ruminococcus sp.]
MNFENTLKSVDEIIAKLSEGDIPLEEAVEIYKKGAAQIEECRKMLEEAKGQALKVTVGEGTE